jgi:hypothetical protein
MNTAPPPFLNLEYFFNLIFRFLQGVFGFENWRSFIFGWQVFAVTISLLSIIGIADLIRRIVNLRRAEAAHSRARLETVLAADKGPAPDPRWQEILASLESTEPAVWRHAIMEADKILEEIVARLPVVGNTLGERLKNVEPGDFLTINEAWEAHKVRNRIAHEAGFQLSEREAKLAIERYRKVFDEFSYF